MANIFDDLEVGKSVFKDKQPLDHRFLPENLPHRKEQITQIAKYWIEALNNVTPSDITIYGKTGTGKTAAAKFAREQLNEAASNKNVFIKVEYIRCTDYTTEYQVIAQLCQKLGRNVPHRGWTKGEVINTFRDIFRRNAYGKKLILIVILDEIDILLSKDGDGILNYEYYPYSNGKTNRDGELWMGFIEENINNGNRFGWCNNLRGFIQYRYLVESQTKK